MRDGPGLDGSTPSPHGTPRPAPSRTRDDLRLWSRRRGRAAWKPTRESPRFQVPTRHVDADGPAVPQRVSGFAGPGPDGDSVPLQQKGWCRRGAVQDGRSRASRRVRVPTRPAGRAGQRREQRRSPSSAPRPATARRSCWPTGSAGRTCPVPGWRWTRRTTTPAACGPRSSQALAACPAVPAFEPPAQPGRAAHEGGRRLPHRRAGGARGSAGARSARAGRRAPSPQHGDPARSPAPVAPPPEHRPARAREPVRPGAAGGAAPPRGAVVRGADRTAEPSRPRRPRHWRNSADCTSPLGRPPIFMPVPTGGPRGSGSPPCRCATTLPRSSSSPPSPATSARWPTTSPVRCSPTSRRRKATSSAGRASATPSRPRWPRSCPAAPTPSTCSVPSSARPVSSWRPGRTGRSSASRN